MIEGSQHDTATLEENIQTQLLQAGIDMGELNIAIPAFIPRADNCFVSLGLEAYRELILQSRSSTAEE